MTSAPKPLPRIPQVCTGCGRSEFACRCEVSAGGLWYVLATVAVVVGLTVIVSWLR